MRNGKQKGKQNGMENRFDDSNRDFVLILRLYIGAQG